MELGKEGLKQAVLWESGEDKKVRCKLCNWRCSIDDGKLGRCCVRKNIDGTLYSLTYDKVCSANREEAFVSFPAWLPEFFDCDDGLQFSVRVLSELADKPSGSGGWTYRRSSYEARENSRGSRSIRLQEYRLYLYRADDFYGAVQ